MDNLITLSTKTCIDINEYYRKSKTPKFIKKYISKKKYKKLEKMINIYKESTSFIDVDTFYSLLTVLFNMDYKERKPKYRCLNLNLNKNESFDFVFEFPLKGIEEDNINYIGIVDGKASISTGNISIRYTLASQHGTGVVETNKVGVYSEVTRNIVDSLVLLNSSTANKTTVSYKMIYCQNYFAMIVIIDIFKYIEESISNFKRILED